MRRGLASPGRDAGRMAACRRHLPGACNTSSPPPGLTEPSGACRHPVAADRPRRAGRAILSFSIGGAGGVQSGMGCAGGAGKKLLVAMPPQWRISANLFRRQGGESGRGSLAPSRPSVGELKPPPPSGRESSPRSASSIGQRQGGGRAEEAAALLCSPPPSPPPRSRTPPRRGRSHFGSCLAPSPSSHLSWDSRNTAYVGPTNQFSRSDG